ncbi:hypothetical protein BDW71DRAFT_141398 [Aspergillus fruticulosus]
MRFSPWTLIEVWLTTQLLRSPTFHRMVGRVHGKFQRLRHGTPPEEMGGTNIDNIGKAAMKFTCRVGVLIRYSASGPAKQFFQYFKEEIKEQLKGKKPGKNE